MKKAFLLAFLAIFIGTLTQAQTIFLSKQMNMNPTRNYVDSLFKVPVLNTDRTFATASTNGLSVDSIGQIWMRPDSIKLFGRFPGNLIKALVTQDSLMFGNSNIRNQFTTPQVGSFNITGTGVIATSLSLGTTSIIAGTLLNASKVFDNAATNVVGIRSTPQAYDNVSAHTNGLVGGIFQPIITGSNTQNWNSGAVQGISVAPTINSGATGLISNVYMQTLTRQFNASGATIDSVIYSRKYPTMTATPSTINNEIYDLVGISGGIGGLWSRYDATGYKSFWGTGNQLINTFTDNGFGEKLQVNGRVNISNATRSTNAVTKAQLDSSATAALSLFIQNQTAVGQLGNGFWSKGTGRLDGNIFSVRNSTNNDFAHNVEVSSVDAVLRSYNVSSGVRRPQTFDGLKYTFQDVANGYAPFVIENGVAAVDSQARMTVGYTAATNPAITDSVKLFVKGGVIIGPRQHFSATGDLNILGRNALTGRMETSIASQKDGPAGAPGQEVIIGNVPQAVSSSFAKLYVGDTVAVGGGYHGIGTYDVVSSTNASLGAYAAVDIRTQLVGSTGFNHYVGVQSRAVLAGTAGISNYWYGMEALATHNGSGTVANYAGLRVGNILGSGPVTNNYGILIHSQTRGTNNWNIRSESGLHFFGGTATNTASTVQVNGSFAARIVTFTGTAYTMNSIDFTLLCTNTGTVTVTLPDATTCSDRIYHIKKANSGATNVTVQTTGGQNIDQTTTASIAPWATLTVQSNGTQWYIL